MEGGPKEPVLMPTCGTCVDLSIGKVLTATQGTPDAQGTKIVAAGRLLLYSSRLLARGTALPLL